MLEEMSIRGMSKNSTRSAPQAPTRASTSARATPLRAATATRASDQTSSAHARPEPARLVGAQDQRDLVTGHVALQQHAQGVRRVGGPPRSTSARDTLSRASPFTASSHSWARTSAPGSSSSARWVGSAERHQQHAIEPQRPCASCAQTSAPCAGG